VSIKYGATIGLALAALVMLGVIGMTPEQPQGAAAPKQLASITGTPPLPGPVRLAAVSKAAPAAFTCEGNLLQDPSFELSASSDYWQESSTGQTPLCDSQCDGTLHSRTGNWWAWFPGSAETAVDSALWQTVVIPKNEYASLTFYLAIPQAETPLTLRVLVDNQSVFQASELDAAAYAGYARVSVDVKAFADGQAHVVRFEGHVAAGVAPGMYVDDVCLRNAPADKAVPGTINDLIANGTSSESIQLQWTDVTGETQYIVQRKTAVAEPWQQIAQLPASGPGSVEYGDEGLAMGGRYYYRVLARSADGETASNVADARTYCEVTFKVQPPGTGSVEIQGASPCTYGCSCSDECSYEFPATADLVLTASPNSGYAFSTWTGGTTCTTSSLCPFTVDGNATVTAVFQRVPPPSNVRAEPVANADAYVGGNNSIIKVTWNYTEDSTGQVSGFVIEWSDGSSSGQISLWPLDREYYFSGEACRAYRFRMATQTWSSGWSSWSPAVLAYTHCLVTLPDVPVGGTVTAPGPLNDGIACGTQNSDNCSEEYQYGSYATLTAVPDDGQQFLGWNGLTSADEDDGITCVIRMNRNPVIVAAFGPDPCNEVTYTYTANPMTGPVPMVVTFTPTFSIPGTLQLVSTLWYVLGPDPEQESGEYVFPDDLAPIEIPYSASSPAVSLGGVDYPVFNKAGKYVVGMRLRIKDPNSAVSFLCPPLGDAPYIAPDPLNASNDLELEAVLDSASFEVEDLICANDTMGLLPMNDWVPLFWFRMGYNESSLAPRVLTFLEYSIHKDSKAVRSYARGSGPQEEDIYEYGLFVDSNSIGVPDKVLNLETDGRWVWRKAGYMGYSYSGFHLEAGEPMLKWDNHGFPYETPDEAGNLNINDEHYHLSFCFDPRPLPVCRQAFDYYGCYQNISSANYYPAQANGFWYTNVLNPANPKFPFLRTYSNPEDPYGPFSSNYVGDPLYTVPMANGYPDPTAAVLNWPIAGVDPYEGYIVAVRLSSVWDTTRTFGVTVYNAAMQPWAGPTPTTDMIALNQQFPHEKFMVVNFPTDESGKPVDSYNPNFYASPPQILAQECGYSSSFDVFDVGGDTIYPYQPGAYHNNWNWQIRKYTPIGEHARPRWDISDTFFEAVSGEWLDIRRLFSADAWVPVVGINMHGECTAQIDEVNLILTDIGGDPYGVPGNGGFNPNDALEVMTTTFSGTGPYAVQSDYSFNGAWLWYDVGGSTNCSPPLNCNADGIFEPPVPADPTGASYGINFIDYPMVPEDMTNQNGFCNQGINQWEYIPFPPGGGDPWWKIKMRFAGGRRNPDGCRGTFEPAPEPAADFFVVLHTDSGYRDLSGLTGDGNGIKLGADFRAFIEPRRWDSRNGGHWAGGISTSNMFAGASKCGCGGTSVSAITTSSTENWQDNPAWDTVSARQIDPQPWWHERVTNRDNTKPMRCGMEVHDLVLTYSTYNAYAKETFITVGQLPPKYDAWIAFLSVTYGYGNEHVSDTGGLTWFSLWMDPVKIYDSGDVFGIQSIRFYNFHAVGIQPDVSEGIFDNTGNNDQYTGIQYSFETVPFNVKNEDTTVDELGGHLTFPRSYFYPFPPEQPTLPDYSTWPPADLRPDGFPVSGSFDLGNTTLEYSLAFGAQSIVYVDENSVINNTVYHEADYQQGQTPNEATYQDDIVYADLQDCQICGQDLLVDGPLFYIDSDGGKYRVLAQNGTVFTLENARAAYRGKFYETEHQELDEDCNPVVDGLGNAVMSDKVSFPYYPFDPCGRAGRGFAIVAGRWVLARDVLKPGQYPRMDDWKEGLDSRFAVPADKPVGDRAARLLKQHIEYNSQPTAMLGINLTASDDPVVNRHAPTSLNRVTVAFWGPEFSKTDLAKLDSESGALVSSGVMLYEDTNGDGVFDGPVVVGSTVAFVDKMVPMNPANLIWGNAPEPVDLDGDNVADDLSGDGLVVLSQSQAATYAGNAQYDGLYDLAWVLQLEPLLSWVLPETDTRNGGANPPSVPWQKSGGMEAVLPGSAVQSITAQWPDYWGAAPQIMDVTPLLGGGDTAKSAEKSLARGGNQGDDLFVVVRTSESISQFEQFRCFIPARLPGRSLPNSYAGIDIVRGLTPSGTTVGGPVEKLSPDEGAVQDFYGHDMLETSVPSRIVDLSDTLISSSITPAVPVVVPGGPPVAVLGIDCAANRPEYLIAKGSQGETSGNVFTTSNVTAGAASSLYYTGKNWTSKAVGLWLVGMGPGDNQNSRMEAFEITGVNGNALTLRAGAPKNGSRWVVVKDPSFLEQVIVEFYDQSNQTLGRHFNPYNDLLPLNNEDPVNGIISGVSLYRDNDWDPRNTNGVFDPPILNANNQLEYIDLPVRLDDVPVFIGVQGEPEYQVKMVFSSPGTDDTTGRVSVPYEQQPNLRQWIPQELGTSPAQETYGPDFFVVLRTSRDMNQGDTFRVGIVSWGPITPTEPDPDTFSNILGTSQKEDEFDKFSEFPWGARGLGYITFFQNPPDMYFWTYNREKDRLMTTHEVDHSQDDKKIKYWIRSNPNQAGVTAPIYSLQRTDVDFSADRHRQVVGGDIQFTLIATGTIAKIQWDFGDGAKSTERNPKHTYQQEGLYTVSVTVTDRYGIEVTETKTDYIEIVDAPFVDFIGTPTSGIISEDLVGGTGCGLSVQFTDLSVGTNLLLPTAWFWNFGDNTAPAEQRYQNPKHRYTKEGFYTVTLEVTFTDSDTGAAQAATYRIQNYITVRPPVAGCGISDEGEGDTEELPASFAVNSTIKDKESLVPLNDWVPLFHFTMGYPADNPAPRLLSSLVYRLRPDKRDPDDLNYGNQYGPFLSDILEFGLFKESDGGDKGDLVLDVDYDQLLYVWDNMGNTDFGTIATLLPDLTEEGLSLAYELDFIGDGTASEPQFPILAEAVTDNGLNGASYHVAVRTSATWRSQTTLGCDVLSAQMVKESGAYPLKDGKPVDSYTPNFSDGETLEPESAYSASFAVWDITGTPTGEIVPGFFDAWNAPGYLFTPPAEFSRPRWSSTEQLMSLVSGEFLEIKNLTSLDTWTALIGINLHSAKSLHFDQYEAGYQSRMDLGKDGAQLREVNIVLTDIGADPLGEPGNGGFNPNIGLEHYTGNIWGAPIIEDQAFAEDVTYNGVWVWHDTNNNGVFDAPTALPEGGVQYNGDYPMLPEAFFARYSSYGNFNHSGDGTWEHIPFPPGGGDPWWRTTLHFFEGRRKGLDKITDKANVEGYAEKTPDNVVGLQSPSEYTCDYFVVIRTDSGFQDVSLAPGDNAGLAMGADFRAFIEPRRINAQGLATGGIYVDSMIPGLEAEDPDMGDIVWQQDTRWGQDEPWWPERTVSPISTKPVKYGLEVHDLVLTYQSDSIYLRQTDLFFGDSTTSSSQCFGYSLAGGDPTDFSLWTDPFGLSRARFLNGHAPGVTRWRLFGQHTFTFGDFTFSLSFDDRNSRGQFAYETVPFFHNTAEPGSDLPPAGPRSAAYSQPPWQPALPDYDTWPKTLGPNEYPKASDWAPEDAKARLLTQKTDINSDQTPMLGLNLAGSLDPLVIKAGETSVASITVAFWGPNFTPSDLAALDSTGKSSESGILLYEDTDGNGMFMNSKTFESYTEYPVPVPGFDTPVPLNNLAWPSQSELIDLDGDGLADDLDGNGLVDDRDKAWVVTLTPANLWQVPHQDGILFDFKLEKAIVSCGTGDFGDLKSGQSSSAHALETGDPSGTKDAGKKLDLAVEQPGDDLFITVRTSESTQRFEQFRAVIPATLPTRAEGQRKGGVQFLPQVNTSASSSIKNNPDEDPVQDFYGHDMLEVNIPAKIVDITNQSQVITIGGAALPVLGLDLSTNRGDAGVSASGTAGTGGERSFTVQQENWAVDAFAGDWLLDSAYEPYQILGNTANQLNLLSGTPRTGSWKIVSEPSFLEQVIVEFYNEGTDTNFNPTVDLLPLNKDQVLSGVALYRDNDNDPNNRNGVFDAGIDIPLPLDAAPVYTGQTAEDIQVKFVFSSPGTDDYPAPMDTQARNRQWVPDSFGGRAADPYTGSDFFVVLRAADKMSANDNFRVGIVSWGPNTPTEPDPDTWAVLSGEERNDFTKFEEFPWGARGLGFVTFFKNPPLRYSLIGAKAGKTEDNSGFNWIRSHSAKKRRSGVITARTKPVSPTSVIISSASVSQLPSQTLDGAPFNLVIYGSGFGTSPVVALSGYDVQVTSATDASIGLSISTPAGTVPVAPIVLIVRNPQTGQEGSRSDLFTLKPGGEQGPAITGVSPSRGTKDVFPVVIIGERFSDLANIDVTFGRTLMPVLDVNAAGTRITVGFPTGGLPDVGRLDVKVSNVNKGTEAILLGGFDYVNDAQRPKVGSAFGCGSMQGRSGGGIFGDLALMGLVALALAVPLRHARRRHD